MRVLHRSGQVTELAAPILGDDFAAGMALGANVFRLIRLEAVLKIYLIEVVNSDVPHSRYVPIEAIESLERLPLPFSIRWQPLADKFAGSVTVLDLLGKTLLVEALHPENFQLLPLGAIAHLDLADVENFGDNI